MWEIPVPGWLCMPRCRHAPALGSGCTRTRRGLTPVLPFPYPNSRIHRGLQPQPKRVPSFQGLLPCMGLPDSAQGGSNHPPAETPSHAVGADRAGVNLQNGGAGPEMPTALLPAPHPGMELDELSPKHITPVALGKGPTRESHSRRCRHRSSPVPASVQPHGCSRGCSDGPRPKNPPVVGDARLGLSSL